MLPAIFICICLAPSECGVCPMEQQSRVFFCFDQGVYLGRPPSPVPITASATYHILHYTSKCTDSYGMFLANSHLE